MEKMMISQVIIGYYHKMKQHMKELMNWNYNYKKKRNF